MSELPPGASGSRWHYTFTITAREREAVQRFINWRYATGDVALIQGVFAKIAAEQEPIGDFPHGEPPNPVV